MKGWAPDENATEENGKVYSFIVKSKEQEEPPVNDEPVNVELLLSADAGYFMTFMIVKDDVSQIWRLYIKVII